MTILVVDDYEPNLYQLQVLLGASGYQVVTAANGDEALVKARQNPPSLVISDILMPVMDGFALCREWRKDERLRTIPFVFYTATYTDERDRKFALGLGADRFIIKPEDHEVFLLTILEVLHQEQSPPGHRTVNPPDQEETDYLKQYNATLVRKLETKMEQLEQSNREQARLLQEIQRHAADLEKRVAERTNQLEESNKELEAFSYSVSHDLRAPLRIVDGFTHILLKNHLSQLDDEGKHVCYAISKGARNMGRLIDDLLAFSQCGRAAMRPSMVDMAAMARAVLFIVTTPEDRERIDYQVSPLPSVVGDATLLRQVWINLLSNAVKFSSRKERALIEVGAELQEGAVVYSVRDNGDGFDMKYAGKLFGVFQRLHSETEFEGTGVGLSIVQRIILRHGGRVWAEGATGKGATFQFSMPKEIGNEHPDRGR